MGAAQDDAIDAWTDTRISAAVANRSPGSLRSVRTTIRSTWRGMRESITDGTGGGVSRCARIVSAGVDRSERRAPGEGEVEHGPGLVDVTALVDRRAPHLLGRHVVDVADHAGAARALVDRLAAEDIGAERGPACGIRQAEVEQAHAADVEPAVSVDRDHDVGRRDVTVDEPHGVRRLERSQHAVGRRERVGDPERSVPIDVLGEAQARGAFERDPRDGLVGCLVHADLEHPDDVRMPQPLHPASLGEERVARARPLRQVRVEELERDVLAARLVHRREDRRRAARAEELAETVAPRHESGGVDHPRARSA